MGSIAEAACSLSGATGAAIAMPCGDAVECVGRSGETAPELGARLNLILVSRRMPAHGQDPALQ